MVKKQAIIDNFYLKTFLTGWGICCVVWSFMIFQFWWGNHDWGYLKSGVSLASGFFEARYSQHLPTILLLGGHVLPVLTIIATQAAIVIEAMLIALYFGVPKTMKNYLFLILFMGLNPYNFILFYYVYLSFVFIAWCVCGVGMLFLAERPLKWYNTLFVGILFCLILGSYPPNVALFLVLFMSKRLLMYIEGKENLKGIIIRGLAFGLALGLGYCGFKFIYSLLLKYHQINLDMYNISTKGLGDVLAGLPMGVLESFGQLFQQRTFVDGFYCLFTGLLVFGAVCCVEAKSKNKIILTLLLLAIFVVSRFCLLLAHDSHPGVVRLEYFSRLGLYIFAIVVLLKEKNKGVQNFVFVIGCVILFLFSRTVFDLQKVQNLGFTAARNYQSRLLDKLVVHDDFKFEKKYISLAFGNPSFRNRYLTGDVHGNGEMVAHSIVFYFDVVNFLFWEEKFSPVIIGAGFLSDGKVLVVDRGGEEKWRDISYWKDNPENMKNLRYWVYTQAKMNSFYVDDKYIIAVLDMLEFNKNKERMLTSLDK